MFWQLLVGRFTSMLWMQSSAIFQRVKSVECIEIKRWKKFSMDDCPRGYNAWEFVDNKSNLGVVRWFFWQKISIKIYPLTAGKINSESFYWNHQWNWYWKISLRYPTFGFLIWYSRKFTLFCFLTKLISERSDIMFLFMSMSSIHASSIIPFHVHETWTWTWKWTLSWKHGHECG